MADDQSNPSPFESKLSEGRQRFLAHAIEHALGVGRRSAHDFIRHFPPEAIMEGLAQQPELRASILAQTTGIKARIAAKKSWQSAAEDLSIALSENETNAAAVVAVFQPDDRVRFLDHQRLWAFLVEGDFWTVAATKGEEFKIAKQHLAFLLERALRDGLVTHEAVISGITVGEVATRLPKVELGKIIEGALQAGKKKAPFTEVELWAALTAPVLVEYVPLAHIWSTVLVPRVAETHGYVPAKQPEEPVKQATAAAGATEEWLDVADEAGAASARAEEVSEDDFA